MSDLYVSDKSYEELQQRLEALEAENEKLRNFIDTRIPDQGRQIKQLKAKNERLRAIRDAAISFRMMFGSTARQTEQGRKVDAKLHAALAAEDE